MKREEQFLIGTTIVADANNKQLLIDFLGYDISKIETTLLYKATTDGWKGTDFHSKCDNKGWTLVIV